MNDMNMMKKRFCPGDCAMKLHYIDQAGTGYSDIQIYRGVPYQKGTGLFTNLFRRYGIPLTKYLGKKLLKTGVAIGGDILSEKRPKDSVKRRIKEVATDVIKEGLKKIDEQSGSGTQRRRKIIKGDIISTKPISNSTRRRPRTRKDIFSL